jgi:hypothetical protein
VLNVPLGSFVGATAASSAPSLVSHVYLGSLASDLSTLVAGGASSASGLDAILKLAVPTISVLLLGQWFRQLLSAVAGEDSQ